MANKIEYTAAECPLGEELRAALAEDDGTEHDWVDLLPEDPGLPMAWDDVLAEFRVTSPVQPSRTTGRDAGCGEEDHPRRR